MKHFKALLFFILLALGSFAQKSEMLATFEQANKLYAEGKFAQSATLYDSIIASGYESADLYYNTGNAYFRLNKNTEAIYFYEKSKQLAPSNEALIHNLELANLQIYDKIKPMPEFALKRFFRALIKSQSADFWAYTSVFLFVIVLGLIYLYLVSGKQKVRLFSFLGGLFLIALSTTSFVFAADRQSELTHAKSGIIFAPAVSVKSEPNNNSAELFVIHEGLKVEITDYSENWYEVKLASGMTGWVKKNGLKNAVKRRI